ncbi:phosphoenolpyruvate--protein phosphotransferase [Brucepastera parasyntrophica]|uniref:phosphoenolpyruvate--protein phosphotransferase n=1 Tax=Brucepastera parasyntrophica TaxID=2880008 RepID=UPI002108EC69|nr:phosphoenolpyruvate--protein phosphotransferase [Brucepastera parasyntrophica]ULQ58473.1 phosphoenolpyruvate--protein phosphotransferase [Brucepastera parasyntrophica]
MRKLEGLSASPGIAVAPVFCFREEKTAAIPKYRIDSADIETQWKRFQTALEQSREEILLLKDDRNKFQSEILEAHLMMLSDPEFIPQIHADLKSKKLNVENILKNKIDETTAVLRASGDTYLAERAVDIEDAFGRVMNHLLQDGTAKTAVDSIDRFVPPGTILAAKNLKPSEALALKDAEIAGILLEEGGATSHVAILARTWRIPAVMGLRGILGLLSDGMEIVLDADDGLVIIDPPADVLSFYRSRSDAKRKKDTGEKTGSGPKRKKLPAVTTDGAAISLRANIALADEVRDAKEKGAEGVGLFRSEYLFLGSDVLPDEETQFAVYREVVKNLDGYPAVIRTLDAGADKMLHEQAVLEEKNPLLGWRAIRYSIDHRDMFSAQLRALLRASNYGDLRIMFPMISNMEELDIVLEIFEDVKASCVKNRIPFNKNVKTGIMIEVPSAATCADLFAKKVDFMSIGTNDLIQYTMAVDRENPKVAYLYDYYNPAVLRLIKRTITAGKRSGVEVSMCGEMAGDPGAVFLLIGMGLRTFSMAPVFISAVRDLIRKVSVEEAAELAEAAMEMSAAREIKKLIQGKIKSYE